jgi:hypothetical protein
MLPELLGDSGALGLETSRRLLEAQGGHTAIRVETAGCALVAVWPLQGLAHAADGTRAVFFA